MLQSILHQNLNFKIISISDNVEVPGDMLFSAIAVKIFQTVKDTAVYFVCSERSTQFYSKKYSNFNANVKFVDTQSMPLKRTLNSSNVLDLFATQKLSSNDVIIFDSINSFLWGYPVHLLAQEIYKLSQMVDKIIFRIHTDVLLNKSDSILLQYLNNKNFCHINMITIKDHGFITKVIHGRPVKRSTEFCYLRKDGQINSETYSPQITPAATRIVPMETLTTFDLGVKLSQSEKEARDRLVLPYLRTSDDFGAKIEYEADDADLEEDPDEDLEL